MANRRFPLLGKSAALAGVVIALTLALQTVSGIVAEREGRLREAERSVAAGLASAQTLVGPVIERDCSEAWETTQGEGKDRKTVTERRQFRLSATPATLDVKGDVALEPRYRGIFKVNGYVLKARLVAAWNDGATLVPEAQHPGSRLHCDAPVMFVALGDFARRAQRGDADRRRRRAGARRNAARFASARLPRRCRRVVRRCAPAAARRGRRRVWSAPASSRSPRSQAAPASPWLPTGPHPSFAGRLLPIERQVGETGFAARWQLSSLLATTAPRGDRRRRAGDAGSQDGDHVDEVSPREDSRRPACVETFGVAFMDPVSPYALADRATKYGSSSSSP